MDHSDYTLRISLALDGALPPEERAMLDEHLRECRECAALYQRLMAFDRAVRASPWMAPQAGFVERVNVRLQRRRSQQARAVGGLVLVMSALGIWLTASLVMTGLVGWWLSGHPTALDQIVQAIRAMAATAEALGEGIWLLWRAAVSHSLQPLLAAYLMALGLMSLAWSWLGRRLRDGRPEAAA